MIYHRVLSCALRGLSGILVEIEVSVLPGLPVFEISGRGDSAIRESKDRVRAAIRNSGYDFPRGRVIASYAPAAIPKQGSAFDLPLAIAILGASQQIVRPVHAPAVALFGELALNGRVKPVQGMFGRLLALMEKGICHVIGPVEGCAQANQIEGLEYEGVGTLKEAVLRYSGFPSSRRGESDQARSQSGDIPLASVLEDDSDGGGGPSDIIQSGFERIRGQAVGIRACQIAAAGWHSLLMVGAPGCGKTTLASAIPSILPPLNREESIELTKIYSMAGKERSRDRIMTKRPFRRTHHTVSTAALIGGGVPPHPGECTLAHRGVLFLDEITEMRSQTLDALREPVETGFVHLSRADWQVDYPCEFLLVAACNPCRCGYLLEPDHACHCDDGSIQRHFSRISGPLYDRFDLVVPLTRVTADELTSNPAEAGEENQSRIQQLRQSVARAWEIQEERAGRWKMQPFYNGRAVVSNFSKVYHIEEADLSYAARWVDREMLSARTFMSVLHVARTIADLDAREVVLRDDIDESFQYHQPLPYRQA